MQLIEQCLVTRLTLRQRLQELSSAPAYMLADVEEQVAALFTTGFLRRHGFKRIKEYPRYLEAVKLRLAKAPFMGPRDKPETECLAAWQGRLRALGTESQLPSQQLLDAIEELRWMLEEYRVSVFAQSLKTKLSVSPKRIEKAFDEIEKLATRS